MRIADIVEGAKLTVVRQAIYGRPQPAAERESVKVVTWVRPDVDHRGRPITLIKWRGSDRMLRVYESPDGAMYATDYGRRPVRYMVLDVERPKMRSNPTDDYESAEDVDRDEIAEGISKYAWIDAWDMAWSHAEEDNPDVDHPVPAGGQIEEYAPEPPHAILELGPKLIREIEKRNGISIEKAFIEAQNDPYAAPKDEEEFGYQIVMAWLGHGTDFPDDEDALGRDFELGHGEVGADVTDVDEEEVELSYVSIPLKGMR